MRRWEQSPAGPARGQRCGAGREGGPEGGLGGEACGVSGWGGKQGCGSRLGLRRHRENCLEMERFGQEGGEGEVEVAVGKRPCVKLGRGTDLA